MADDQAVSYAIGFLEGWIPKAAIIANSNTGEEALNYLKIIEDAIKEYRRTISTFRKVAQRLKTDMDALSLL